MSNLNIIKGHSVFFLEASGEGGGEVKGRGVFEGVIARGGVVKARDRFVSLAFEISGGWSQKMTEFFERVHVSSSMSGAWRGWFHWCAVAD